MHINKESLTVDQVINKIFWTAAIGICSFGVNQVGKMSDSVQDLNKNMAVMVERISHHERLITNHDERLLEIEVAKRSRKN